MADPANHPIAAPAAQTLPLSLSADRAISMARSGIRRGAAVRWLLIAAVAAGVVLSTVERMPSLGTALTIGAAVAWVMLVVRSVRRQQPLLDVPMLIEARQNDRADRVIADSLATFSILRAPRVQALQHLAAIRHGQRRSQDAARLAGELVRYSLKGPAAAAVRLLSADSALQLNDLHAAHAALSAVPPPETLGESIKLMQLQTDYCTRTGAWAASLQNLPWKIELAELLPADAAAVVQAQLALAAERTGRDDWCAWLKRRAELLSDRTAIVAQSSAVAPLFE